MTLCYSNEGFGRPSSQNGKSHGTNISCALQRALTCSRYAMTWVRVDCGTSWPVARIRIIVSKSTRTLFNVYQSHKVNSSPSKLVPRWKSTQVNSYPSQIVKAHWALKSVREISFIYLFLLWTFKLTILKGCLFFIFFPKTDMNFFFYFISNVVWGEGELPLWVY